MEEANVTSSQNTHYIDQFFIPVPLKPQDSQLY